MRCVGLFKRRALPPLSPEGEVERFVDARRRADEASISCASLVNLHNVPFLPTSPYTAEEREELTARLIEIRKRTPVPLVLPDEWLSMHDKGYKGVTITNPNDPSERDLLYSRQVAFAREKAERIIVFGGTLRDATNLPGEGYPDQGRAFERWLVELMIAHGGRGAFLQLEGFDLRIKL